MLWALRTPNGLSFHPLAILPCVFRGSHMTMMSGSLCKCGTIRQPQISSPQASFPNRRFYSCLRCNRFDWADATPSQAVAAPGPECNCGEASIKKTVRKDGPNRGRAFWTCASWPKGCKFFDWADNDAAPATPTAPRTPPRSSPDVKLPPLPGFANHLTDWKTLQTVEVMMKSDKIQGGDHDALEVKAVWKITNPSRSEKYQEAKKRAQMAVKFAASKEETFASVVMEKEYKDAMHELSKGTLDQDSAGEVYLLHGTDPNALFNILFQGLDPGFSNRGRFGQGVYFADDAAKIDMYAKLDPRWDKEGPLGDLHQRLYQGCKHPTRVRYALISRVVLGRCVKTVDGKTVHRRDNPSPLFVDEKLKNKLVNFPDGQGASSLIAEHPRLPFREYVIFHPDQIFTEYLVAYQRERSHCDCGKPIAERTVRKQGDNRGRRIHMCGEINDGGKKCDFLKMYPLCYCDISAFVKTSHSTRNPGRNFYCCGSKRAFSRGGHECDFFAWADDICDQGGSPYKRQRL